MLTAEKKEEAPVVVDSGFHERDAQERRRGRESERRRRSEKGVQKTRVVEALFRVLMATNATNCYYCAELPHPPIGAAWAPSWPAEPQAGPGFLVFC